MEGKILLRSYPGPGPCNQMVLTKPPVWRSQLLTHSSSSPSGTPWHVKIRPSGEKTSTPRPMNTFNEGLKDWSRRRVTESKTSIVGMLPQAIAMNLLHGDHTASLILDGRDAAALFGSHDVGAPRTILAKGRACDAYICRTIDSLGANTSAE